MSVISLMYPAGGLYWYLNTVQCRALVPQFSIPGFWKAELVTTTKKLLDEHRIRE